MKKAIIFALCAALALPAAAQSWDQAQLFSQNNYGGTARSIGMGNALTAVGGDPGSVGLNPAGGAVAGYTQFFITPALSISSTTAQGYGLDGAEPIGLGDVVKTGYTRMKMPNLGFMLNVNTGRKHGLKRVSFGFLANSTNDFTSRFNSSGVNYGKDSYSGYLASLADGYTQAQLGTADWFADGPAWESMVGYRSGIFDWETTQGTYLGITDMLVGGKPQAAAPLYQQYGVQTKGYKQDILLNLSFDIADKFYFGTNLGITTLSYSESTYWNERPEDPSTFPDIVYDGGAVTARFNSLSTKRAYGVSGTGVYLKAGFLWRPFGGLRIGGAIQTPTLMNMTGRCAWAGETSMSGKYFSPSQTPEDEWIYSLRMPFRCNAGLAYTFGKYAVLSVDYEMADYSTCRYRGRSDNGFYDGAWTDENLDIRDALGVGHVLRAGLEIKPTEYFAIRAGYNYIGGSQKNWLVWEDSGLVVVPLTKDEKALQATHVASLGLGFASGHFFADLAVRLRFLPTYYYTAYQAQEAPMVRVSAKGIDTALTFGWRF